MVVLKIFVSSYKAMFLVAKPYITAVVMSRCRAPASVQLFL
jgi:hypothetical protein